MENLANHIWRVVVTGLLLLFLTVFFFILLPYVSVVYEKFTLLNEQQEQISFMGNWQERVVKLENRHEELQTGMESMLINLAEEEEFSKVVENLFEYSESSGISIKRIQPISENEQQEFIVRQIQLDLEGGYHSIAGFINKLEQGSFLMVTKSVEMNQINVSEDQLATSLALEVTLLNKQSE
jgi:Tfp pilus assembly protein PilO